MIVNPDNLDPRRGIAAGILFVAMLLAACGKQETPSSRGGLTNRDSVVLGSPATTALSAQRVVYLAKRTVAETLEVPVRIEADERRSVQVTAPAAGRIEENYIRTSEQRVQSGERLALLYSPELVAAQREFLLLDPRKDADLVRQAEERLDRMGLSAGLRRSIRASGTPMDRIPILSPKAGFVLANPATGTQPMDGNATPQSGMGGSIGGGASGGGMEGITGGGAQEAAPGSTGSALRAGTYVARGSLLAQINDLATIAAVLSLPVREAAMFREGDSVHLDLSAMGFSGMARLDFLESQVADSGGNVRARSYLPNPDGRLKLGLLGKAHLAPAADSTWVLPRSAVHELGERRVAWVRSTRDSGAFVAQEIRIGRAGTRWVEVLEGLPPEAAVAENASLLLDPDVVLQPRPLRRTSEEAHGAHDENEAVRAVEMSTNSNGVEPAPDEHPGHGNAEPSVPAKEAGHEGHAAPAKNLAHAGGGGHGSASSTLSLSDDEVRLAGIRTAKAGTALLAPSQTFRAQIQFDSRSRESVPAKIEGRIETVLVLRPGERVRRGQTLATIKSESLLSAQEEYLVARKMGLRQSNPDLIRSQVQAARRRLLVLGMTESQVGAVEKQGRSMASVPIASPRDGILLEVQVRPGQYVAAGSSLFTVGRADRVWVETWLLAQEAAAFPEGTDATVSVEGIATEAVKGRLEHVRQETALSGSVTLAHIGIANPDPRILPGMQAWVTFRRAGKRALSVPVSALLRSSGSTLAWVSTGKNAFAPRMVRTGLETADTVEILSGIEEGESVVVEGAYLLNSEWTVRQGAGMAHGSH